MLGEVYDVILSVIIFHFTNFIFEDTVTLMLIFKFYSIIFLLCDLYILNIKY